MAFYTRPQFCKLCNISQAHISVYVNRGLIVLSGKYIDDTIPVNADFIRKRQDKEATPEKVKERAAKITVKETEYTPETVFIPPPAYIPPRAPDPQEPPEYTSKYDLETDQKRYAISKLRTEIEILEAKKAKMHGDVIPVDLVSDIFSQHHKYIMVEFNNAAERIITRLAKKFGLTNQDVSSMRGEITEETNIAAEQSLDQSQKAVLELVAEYSDSRGRGDKR